MARVLWGPNAGDVYTFVGTVTLNGATPVTVSNVAIGPSAVFVWGLKTVGGTVGALPAVQTITLSSASGSTKAGPQGSPPFTGSFTVQGTALDTSTYNFRIIN